MIRFQVCAQAPNSSNIWTRSALEANGTIYFQSKRLYRDKTKGSDSASIDMRLQFHTRKRLNQVSELLQFLEERECCRRLRTPNSTSDTADERQAQIWQNICRKCQQCPDEIELDYIDEDGTWHHLGFGRDSEEKSPTFGEKLRARLLNYWIPQLAIVLAAIFAPILASSSLGRRSIGDLDWSWLGWSSVVSTAMLFGLLLVLESAAAGVSM